MKKNIFNYKHEGFSDDELSSLKLRQVKNKNIDTIILNSSEYWCDIESKYDEFNNIKNLIINNNKIKIDKMYGNNICIKNTRAQNIYIKDYENLGGLSFPVNKINRNLKLFWNNNTCNIKEINFIFKDKKKKLVLDEFINDEIQHIELYPKKNEDEIYNIYIYIKSKYKNIKYVINSNIWLTEKKYSNYVYTENNIKDGILDLRNINESETINCKEMNVDTLIINKDDLFSYRFHSYFDQKLNVNKITIIDDNDMKLNPEIEILFNDTIKIYNDFITNNELNKYIYLDKNKEIKLIDKEKLLENNEILDVDFVANDDCELIIIKYKNNEYKLIDKYNEYKIDKLFNDFLYLNVNNYDFYNKEKPNLKSYLISNDWYSPFIEKIIDNNILVCIYEDYLEFIERIKLLKELGFTNNAIKYLIDKNYDNLINTKSKIIIDIDEIDQDEINLFNYIGNKVDDKKEYITKKLKK